MRNQGCEVQGPRHLIKVGKKENIMKNLFHSSASLKLTINGKKYMQCVIQPLLFVFA